MPPAHPNSSVCHKRKKKTQAIIENITDIPDHNDNIHSVPYYIAPMDNVNLNDDSVVNLLMGTESAPIYVSDYEDCSEVAIKGERMCKAIYTVNQPNLANVKEDTSTKDDSTAITPPLFEDLLAPPREAKRTSLKRKSKRSGYTQQVPVTPTSHTNIGEVTTPVVTNSTHYSAQGMSSPVSTDLSAAVKSATESAKTAKTRNDEKSKRKFPSLGKKKKKNNKDVNNPVSIDVTALPDEDEDPILEKELEEIALHGGRTGLISGTPGKDAYDLEHGKGSRRFGRNNRRVGISNSSTKIKVADKHRYRDDPSMTSVDDDEADKSWHGMLPSQDPDKKRWTKKMVIWTVAKVMSALLMLIVLSAVLANKKREPQPGDPLTAEQQQIDTILIRITGPKLLTDPNTPQHLARQWLLYEDDIVKTASEEGVIQRYALAVFHFSTGGGDKHWAQNNWLIGPECGNDDREPWEGLNCNPEGEVRAMVFGTYLPWWKAAGVVKHDVIN
jgi:hypothetical protein